MMMIVMIVRYVVGQHAANATTIGHTQLFLFGAAHNSKADEVLSYNEERESPYTCICWHNPC